MRAVIVKKNLYLLSLFSCVALAAFVYMSADSTDNEVFANKLPTKYTRDAERTWPIYESKFALSDYDREVAKDLLNGGYIIVMRHAHREKWIDVTMYDALELLKMEDGHDTYYKEAVCLSDRQGVHQAKVMGEFVKMIQIPIGKIISSPSCRARETAEYVFGGYDEIKTRLLHFYGNTYGPFDESAEKHYAGVKALLLSERPNIGVNTIISAHNNTIRQVVVDDVLDANNLALSEVDWLLEEGGFHVLKEQEGKLLFVTKFHNFQGFANLFFQRPENYLPGEK